MNDKKMRYISWVSISLLLFILFFMNTGPSRYGLFTTHIEYTLAFDIFKDLLQGLSIRRHTASDTAYFLWFVFLTAGSYLAWRYRYKTAALITRYIKKIHEKV